MQQTPTKFTREAYLFNFASVCVSFCVQIASFFLFSMQYCWFCPTMTKSSSKRARTTEISVDDVLHYARIIMDNDPFKDRAPAEEDRRFKAIFGVTPEIVLMLWLMLVEFDFVPANGTLIHFLWTLMYLKTYPKWVTMKQLTRADPKTLRLWVFQFRDALELLSFEKVSKLNKYKKRKETQRN